MWTIKCLSRQFFELLHTFRIGEVSFIPCISVQYVQSREDLTTDIIYMNPRQPLLA